MRKPKIDYARFTDTSRTLIRYEFNTDINTGKATIAHEMFNMDNEMCKYIVDEIGMEKLEQNTLDFVRDEARQYEAFSEFYLNYGDYTGLRAFVHDMPGHDIGEKIEAAKDALNVQVAEDTITEIEIPVSLQSIRDLANDKEGFFKIKLEIFDMPEVKESKDREWKAKMRKAETTLELLGILHLGLESENEQDESED